MRLSQTLQTLFEKKSSYTVQELFSLLWPKSFGVFLILLSLPAALPIPAPGYATPFGIILSLIGGQILINKTSLWLPKSLGSKTFHKPKEKGAFQKMLGFLSFFERFLRHRPALYKNSISKRFFGGIVLLCGLSMVLPIPLTNTAPSFGIFLLGLGFLEEDSLFGILGSIAGILGIMLSLSVILAVLFLGYEGAQLIEQSMKNALL